VELKLPGRTLRIPERPLTVPAGAYMIWPVNLSVGQSVLRYATAQLLCKLAEPDTYVFFASPGVPPEFVFEERSVETIQVLRGRARKERGTVYIDQIEPGTQVAIRLKNNKREETNVVVLSREQALDLWKFDLAGKERLLLSRAQLYADSNRLTLAGNAPDFKVGIFPVLPTSASGFSDSGDDGIFHLYTTSVKPLALSVKVEKLNPPGADPPLKMSREVALVPEESAFETAGRWALHVENLAPGTSDALLKIKYEGDIARIYAGGKLLTDNFYNGRTWVIGLDRISAEELREPLKLVILPLRGQAPIYLPAGARPALAPDGQIADVKNVEIAPEYYAVINFAP
jgi:beta-galactosidase